MLTTAPEEDARARLLHDRPDVKGTRAVDAPLALPDFVVDAYGALVRRDGTFRDRRRGAVRDTATAWYAGDRPRWRVNDVWTTDADQITLHRAGAIWQAARWPYAFTTHMVTLRASSTSCSDKNGAPPGGTRETSGRVSVAVAGAGCALDPGGIATVRGQYHYAVPRRGPPGDTGAHLLCLCSRLSVRHLVPDAAWFTMAISSTAAG